LSKQFVFVKRSFIVRESCWISPVRYLQIADQC